MMRVGLIKNGNRINFLLLRVGISFLAPPPPSPHLPKRRPFPYIQYAHCILSPLIDTSASVMMEVVRNTHTHNTHTHTQTHIHTHTHTHKHAKIHPCTISSFQFSVVNNSQLRHLQMCFSSARRWKG